ncbi:MAG: hypothetical protein ACR2G2_17785 [Pseudonocardia sp.]
MGGKQHPDPPAQSVIRALEAAGVILGAAGLMVALTARLRVLP